MGIRITADSTCDLSREQIEKYAIEIAPLCVVMDGKPYRDGIDIIPQDIFDYVDRTGKSATTSAVNVEDYLELFKTAMNGYDGLVHFTISSEMSCSYQNACLAAQELENVYVVDSRSLSTGIGQLVLDAAIMAQNDATAKEIFDALEQKKSLLDVSFVLNTLDYLKKGGRCSALTALGANLLSLKPCIEVRGGSMGVGKKYRGTLEKSLLKYVADKLADTDTVDASRIFITDSGVPEPLFEVVRDEVLRHVPFCEVIHTRAGCTISNHCGPSCLGILFYRKQKV